MATPSSTSPDTSFVIDVANLAGSSQLLGLLGSNAKPAFMFARGVVPYWRTQAKSVPAGSTFGMSLKGDGSWKTSTGIGFALSGDSKCTLCVISEGGVIRYSTALEESTTESLPVGAYPGFAYIVVELDFDIKGHVSASGTAGPLGITGKIEGYTEASVRFCHRVDGDMPLSDAVHEAFERFVFPFEPSSAELLNPGDLSQLNFTGTLSCSLDLSYGIDTVRFSAPRVASVLDSLAKGKATFKLPVGAVDIGARARVGYTHSDAFTAVLHNSDTGVFLDLLRADKHKFAESLSVSANVRITGDGSVSVDPTVATQALEHIMPGSGSKIVGYVPQIESALSGGLTGWIQDEISQGIVLGAEWDQFRGSMALFRYRVNTSDPNLVRESCQAFCAGNLTDAAAIGGLALQQGSRILDRHSHSFTLSLHLFNLFAASGKTGLFDESTIEVMPDGSLRYIWDIGEQSDSIVQEAKKTCLIHFVTTATGASGPPQIDLQCELRASANAREAARISKLIEFLSQDQHLDPVRSAMRTFEPESSQGKLTMLFISNPSAWRRLSSSEYNGSKPPADHQQDMRNWAAFRDACASVIDPAFGSLSYADWQQFNVASVYGPHSGGIPDRRQSGNWKPGPFTSFLLNSARFMNLCDDLHRLGGLAADAASAQQDRSTGLELLQNLAWLVIRQDASTDYSKPAIAALVRLMRPAGLKAEVKHHDKSLTCTVTLN